MMLHEKKTDKKVHAVLCNLYKKSRKCKLTCGDRKHTNGCLEILEVEWGAGGDDRGT